MWRWQGNDTTKGGETKKSWTVQFAFSLATPLANISLQKSIDDWMNKKLDFILKNKQPDNYIIV